MNDVMHNNVARDFVPHSQEQSTSSRHQAMGRFPILLLVLVLVLLASGCAPRVAAGSWAGLAADETGIVMTNLDHVTRLNDSGVAIWEYPAKDDRNHQTQFYSTPALTEDTAYVGDSTGKIYALDLANGQPTWINEDPKGKVISGLALANDMLYFGMGDKGVMALDQQTGEQVWFFETGQGVWATPLVVGDRVYATSLDKHLYALDSATGEELWRTSLNGAVGGAPLYDEAQDVLFVGTFGHEVAKIAVSDGEVLDTFSTDNWVWGSPVLVDDILYITDLAGNLYALKPEDFSSIWQVTLDSDGIRPSALVLQDQIVVGGRDGTLRTVGRENGVQQWMQNTGAAILSDLLLFNDETIVVSTMAQERQLVAYALDGTELWQYPVAVAASDE